jgi:dolichol-phosphate mannosyltransferase
MCQAPEPPAVSLIVPARNEGDNLRRLRDRVAAALAGTAWELVVVDDSDDDTPRRLARLAAEDPRVRAVHRAVRGSLASAVVAGARMAAAPVTVVMDADLQHPPEAIPALLQTLAAGADVAVASRFGPGAREPGLSRSRRLHAEFARAVARAVLHEARRTADPLSGFFACPRSALAGLGDRPLGWKVLLDVLVAGAPRRVVDVPYVFAPRDVGRSKLAPSVQWAFLRQLAALAARSPASRRFWLYGGVGALGVGVNLAVYSLGLVVGWPPLLAALFATHAAMAGNFALHTRMTWRDRPRGRLASLGRFVCVSEAGIALTLGVIFLAGRALPGHPLLADVGGIGIAMPATFLANDRWTWWRAAP